MLYSYGTSVLAFIYSLMPKPQKHKTMKVSCFKFIMCIAAFLSAGLFTNLGAQTSFGAKAGYAVSSFRGDDANNIDWQSGFAGGLFVNVYVFDFFTIQPEVLFRQRGGKSASETFNINQNVRLSYMDVPILFKLRIPISETFYPHIYAGPQLSYNINGEYEVSGTSLVAQKDVNVRKIDFGGIMGFGLDVVINKLFLTADWRYGLGALSVDKGDNALKLKNEDISILLGVGVIFGGE